MGGEPQSLQTAHGFDEYYGIPPDLSWDMATRISCGVPVAVIYRLWLDKGRREKRMSEHVFHFTDSARLPWILFNQELRVSLDTQGGQSFLWATTKDTLDRTSACASKAARVRFRTGATRLIRFTLRAEDFERWPDILARFPQYTEETRIYTEAEARRLGETDFAAWRCRADSLPLSKIVRVEWRSYGGGSTWHTLDIGSKCLLLNPEVALNEMGNPIDLGCMLGGKKFYYRQGTWHGQVSYAVGVPV